MIPHKNRSDWVTVCPTVVVKLIIIIMVIFKCYLTSSHNSPCNVNAKIMQLYVQIIQSHGKNDVGNSNKNM